MFSFSSSAFQYTEEHYNEVFLVLGYEPGTWNAYPSKRTSECPTCCAKPSDVFSACKCKPFLPH